MRKLYAILARLWPSPWPWPAPNQVKVTTTADSYLSHQPPCHHSHIRLLTPTDQDIEGHLQFLSQRETLSNVPLTAALWGAGLWNQSHELFDPVLVFELSAWWSHYHPPSTLFPHCHQPPSEFLAKEKPTLVSPPLQPWTPAVGLMSRGDTLLMAHTGDPPGGSLQDVVIRPRPDTSSLSPSTPPHWTVDTH